MMAWAADPWSAWLPLKMLSETSRVDVDGVIERVEPRQAVSHTNRRLATSDLHGVRQEHVGACQIDFIIPGSLVPTRVPE